MRGVQKDNYKKQKKNWIQWNEHDKFRCNQYYSLNPFRRIVAIDAIGMVNSNDLFAECNSNTKHGPESRWFADRKFHF